MISIRDVVYFSMNRILITGGAGFVGSTLALHFQREMPGVQVTCLDNLYRKGSEFNRERIVTAGIEFLHGDVRKRESFNLPRYDLIVDAAAEPSVLAGQDGDVEYVVDTNLGGTLNVLEAARKWSAKLLFLSTSRVYPVKQLKEIALEEREKRFEIMRDQCVKGISQKGISEEFPLRGGRTLYGATKFASEIMVAEYALQFDVKALINRCGVLSGPWQMGKVDQGVFALWIAAHCYEFPLKYIGYGGRQVRDTLHIADLASLVTMQMANDSLWDGRIYNVGGGRECSVSLIELTEIAQDVTGKAIPISDEPTEREGDIPLYISDCSRVCHDCDWLPTRNVRDIASDIKRWIENNRDVLEPIYCR